MLIALTIGIVLTGLCIAGVVLFDSWDDEGLFSLSVIGAILGTVFILIVGIIIFSLHYDRINCNNYEQKTGRDTTFIRTNWGSWDCYTPAKDGKLVPTSQIGDYNK